MTAVLPVSWPNEVGAQLGGSPTYAVAPWLREKASRMTPRRYAPHMAPKSHVAFRPTPLNSLNSMTPHAAASSGYSFTRSAT